MMRTMGAALALWGVTAVTAPEVARADNGPYMWGIGPKLGMIIIPGRYPYAWPSKVANYDFIDEGPNAGDPNDLGADGKPLNTTLQPVGFDLRLGAEGFYGINADNRVGAGLGLATGSHYSDYWLSLNYDRVLFSDNPFDVVAGLQVGYGGTTFRGDEAAGGADEKLKMSYYPIRVRLEGQFRDKVRMYGLGLFVQDAVPARTSYYDRAGELQEAVGGPGNFALFFSAGLEIDVQFGDFTPPKKKKKGGAKKGGGGGGNTGARRGGAAPAPAPKPKPKPGGGGGPQHP
ncbi:MAG: hypothetical protein R3F59_02860 [Myxococcota bacterium]